MNVRAEARWAIGGMMEAVGKQGPNNGMDKRTDSAGDGQVIDPHAAHIDAQIEDFRVSVTQTPYRNLG